MKKYEFTGETLEHNCRTLHRIRRLSDGWVGGWIESEDNLSHKGDCFVYDDAKVFDNALVYCNAKVYGNSWVYGNAQVYGNSKVYENAKVYGNAWVYGNAQVYGNATVYGNACVYEENLVYGNSSITKNYSSKTTNLEPVLNVKKFINIYENGTIKVFSSKEEASLEPGIDTVEFSKSYKIVTEVKYVQYQD